MDGLIFDTSDVERGIKKFVKLTTEQKQDAQVKVSEFVLNESQKEVPLDKGTLQNSGHAEHSPEESIVAYGGNAAPYAVFQHEGIRRDGTHRVINYTHAGRKKKYLEDPIKRNLKTFQKMYGQVWGQIFTM
jgi:hypothetical protein